MERHDGISPPEPILIGVVRDKLDQVWESVEPFLEQATERNIEWSSHRIRELLEKREAQLWISTQADQLIAVGVTQIVVRPKDKSLRVLALAGRDMSSWIHFEETWAEYGRSHGCTKMDMEGRLGWRKVLPHWKPLRLVMERDI